MLLILDNYDSFTYNVFQLLSELGAEVEVIRNDQTTVEDIRAKKYDAIVLSPGPGIPSDAGITEQVIRELGGEVPILGICLGHQAIGEVFGGKVVRPIGRYHSLVIDRATLPDCLEVTSDLADGTIMGVRHKAKNIEGIQFHPESILTPDGKKMMENFLKHL